MFFDKKKAKGEISDRISEKTAGKNRQFSQNGTVFMDGISCFFSFFDQKRAKGEISDRTSEKTVCKKKAIITKRNGFFEGYIVFFFYKKRAKVKFQTEFQEKPPAKIREFLQNVTVYLQSTSCFYSFERYIVLF